MTNLERAWAAELEFGRQIRDIAWWEFEAITLKLAPDTRYTPDFAWTDALGGLHFDETKGFRREDAMAKLKMAAAKFWWATFRLVTRARGRDGAWTVKVIESGHFSLEAAEQRQRRPSATSRPTAMQPRDGASTT